MNSVEYFTSLTIELKALKNRVKNFIDTRHWQTDGEWKESVLKTVLKRHLPKNIEVGRGFVIKPNGVSKQIDILFYNTAKPCLFRDGDLLFLTPDAVEGIIEVKSKIEKGNFKTIAEKLANNREFISKGNDNKDFFSGLFAYETDINKEQSEEILGNIYEIANNKLTRVINNIALGESVFIKFWESSPQNLPKYNKWHFYYLDNIAPGYFINNAIYNFASDSIYKNQELWFPQAGKEGYKLAEKSLYFETQIL